MSSADLKIAQDFSESCEELKHVLEKALHWDMLSHIGGFVLLTVIRISSTLSCGISREVFRNKDSIMVSRYYITYLCGLDGKDVANQANKGSVVIDYSDARNKTKTSFETGALRRSLSSLSE